MGSMSSKDRESKPLRKRTDYDVFLSFRGEDTRRSFAGQLHAALSNRGVVVNDRLLEAIEGPKIAIVILSRNYAKSKGWLFELQQIVERMRVTGQKVLPVFHDVDPSEVRNQTGVFGEVFAEHEQRLKDKIHIVQAWRDALRQLANLSGFVLSKDG